MITNCNVKTITEIKDDKILISCISAENQNGLEHPTLFKTDILDTPKTINNENGVEGELLLTHTDSSENIGELNNKGELILNLQDDNAENYFIDTDGQLKYKENG